MARIATSIEESQKLLELGIDKSSADMRWYREQKWFPYELQPYPYNESIITDDNESMKPAWSLGALIELLPCYPTYKGRILETPYYVEKHEDNSAWASCDFHEIKGEDYIDAAVKLIEWLYTGYLNIKEEKK